MKRFIVRTFLVLVTALVLMAASVGAEEIQVSFTKGQNTELFDINGVHVYLDGTVDDTGMMWLAMNAVIENKSSNTIAVKYEGVCNGWSVNTCYMGGSGTSVRKGAKAKSYVWLSYNELELKRFADITDLTLDFIIEDANSHTELFRVSDVVFSFGDGEETVVEPEYYTDCPVLPTVESYTNVYQSGSNRSSSNGKVTKITYRYRLRNSSDSLSEAFNEYVAAVKTAGLSVTVSGKTATILYGSTKLATLEANTDELTMAIVPGNEKLGGNAGAASKDVTDTAVQPEEGFSAQGDKIVKLGETIQAKTCTLKPDSVSISDKVYSYANKPITSRHYYYEPEKDGNTFIIIHGTFTNNAKKTVDIRNIYATVTVDGYTYTAKAIGVQDGGRDFFNDVSPKETTGVYFYAEVPKSMAKTNGATLRIGFTDDFDYKVTINREYDFTRCSETYQIDLGKKETGSQTAVPGNTTKTTGINLTPVVTEAPLTEPEEGVLGIRSVVQFGSYEQDNDKKNGKEPLEWVVLDIQDGKALLMSVKIIDYVKNNMTEKMLWSKCKVRSWLSDTFYDTAFSKTEKKAIVVTQVHTEDNPYYLRGGCDTKDRLFCLSMTEVMKYFNALNELGAAVIDLGDPLALAEMTEVTRLKAIKAGDINAFDTYVHWVLRDAGDTYCMTMVYQSNTFKDASVMQGGCGSIGVRPVMWVEIDKLPADLKIISSGNASVSGKTTAAANTSAAADDAFPSTLNELLLKADSGEMLTMNVMQADGSYAPNLVTFDQFCAVLAELGMGLPENEDEFSEVRDLLTAFGFIQ